MGLECMFLGLLCGKGLAAGKFSGIFIQCWAVHKCQLVDVFHPMALKAVTLLIFQKWGLLLIFLDSLGSKGFL